MEGKDMKTEEIENHEIADKYRTEVIENHEMNGTITDIITGDNVLERINSYLSSEPLNIRKDDYCYIRIVGNHLEIGRAKIDLVE